MKKENYLIHGNHYISDANDGYAYKYALSEEFKFESHLHDCYEFVYIMKGDLLYTIEGSEYSLSPGDIIFTRPHELHSLSFPHKCVFERQFFHIYPDYIKGFSEIMEQIQASDRGKRNYIPAHIADRYGLHNIFTILGQYDDDTIPETYAAAYSCAILLMAKTNEILRTVELDNLRPVTNQTIHKILQYIYSRLTAKITLDDIAGATFLSPVYISSLFKKEMGMTITSYINMRRIVLAKNRIAAGDKISSLYLECGFENYSTFYRAFSKIVGMSPDEFRKRSIKY